MRLSGLSEEQTAKMLPPNVLLLGYAGSHAYGLNRPGSDIDIKGVSIAPIECYFGLSHFEQKEIRENGYDGVVYELRKFVRLLMGANPSSMELLWLNQNHYIHRSELGNKLIAARQLFITKKCFNSFTGYAYGQLWRIDHTAPTGQMGDKRKQLVEKFGYDTKNASHCIRLLNMCIEILTQGELHVDRAKLDGRYLLEIKDGVYSLEHIKDEAKRLQDLAKEALVRSDLPKDVDFHKCEALVMEILNGFMHLPH